MGRVRLSACGPVSPLRLSCDTGETTRCVYRVVDDLGWAGYRPARCTHARRSLGPLGAPPPRARSRPPSWRQRGNWCDTHRLAASGSWSWRPPARGEPAGQSSQYQTPNQVCYESMILLCFNEYELIFFSRVDLKSHKCLCKAIADCRVLRHIYTNYAFYLRGTRQV